MYSRTKSLNNVPGTGATKTGFISLNLMCTLPPDSIASTKGILALFISSIGVPLVVPVVVIL